MAHSVLKRTCPIGTAHFVSRASVTPVGRIMQNKTGLARSANHTSSSSGISGVNKLVGLSAGLGHHQRLSTVKTSSSSFASPSSSEESHSLTPVLLAVAVATAGAFAFGYHLGVVNGPLDQIAADLGFSGDKAMQGLVVSSTLAGAALGSLSGGTFADWLGRRMSFLVAAIPMIVGPLLSAWATDINGMVLGRFMAGLAIGLSSAIVPTYITEIAPTRLRGSLGTANQLMICVGILAALCVNVALPGAQWRDMFKLAVLPAAALTFGMLFSPESPSWLVSKNRLGAAEDEARKLWGPSGAAALTLTSGSAEASAGWGDLFSGRYRKGVLIGAAIFLFQQLAGINALVFFSTSVFRQAGVTSDTLASAAVGVTNVVGTIIAASLMEVAGRKQLLTYSFLGQSLSMFVMAAGFVVPALQPYSATLAVGGTLAYILAFALGAGPVPGVIVPELNPDRIRSRAVSFALVTHWVANIALGQTFMGAVAAFSLSNVYVFFGLVALTGALYVNSSVPETKGKSFEQIEKELKL